MVSDFTIYVNVKKHLTDFVLKPVHCPVIRAVLHCKNRILMVSEMVLF